MYRKLIASEIKIVTKKSGGFISEFKTFALKGNVIELAVGVIIGTAFNNIVQSIVKDLVTPPISLLTGKVNFENMYWNLSSVPYSTLSNAESAGAPIIRYGVFLNNLIQFLITAFVIFLVVKQINKFTEKNKEKTPEPKTKTCPYCFSSISPKATRCPNCTSKLSIEDINSSEMNDIKPI